MQNMREQSWSEFLDEEKENLVFVKFVFSGDFSEIKEFVISFISIIKEEPKEIIRFDCGEKEPVHVHRFYSKKQAKRFLKKEKSFETLQGFIKDVRKNWRQYRSKYAEKHNII